MTAALMAEELHRLLGSIVVGRPMALVRLDATCVPPGEIRPLVPV